MGTSGSYRHRWRVEGIARLVKCLPYNHEDQVQLIFTSHIKNWAQRHMPGGSLELAVQLSLAQSMSSRLSERSCLQKKSGEEDT